MTGKAAIAAWLADYRSDFLARELEPAERMLVEEVLLDFLLEEQWLDHRPVGEEVRHALEVMRALNEPDRAPAFERLSAAIMEAVNGLEARLARQEHANLIMREHLAMLTSLRPADRRSTILKS